MYTPCSTTVVCGNPGVCFILELELELEMEIVVLLLLLSRRVWYASRRDSHKWKEDGCKLLRTNTLASRECIATVLTLHSSLHIISRGTYHTQFLEQRDGLPRNTTHCPYNTHTINDITTTAIMDEPTLN